MIHDINANSVIIDNSVMGEFWMAMLKEQYANVCVFVNLVAVDEGLAVDTDYSVLVASDRVPQDLGTTVVYHYDSFVRRRLNPVVDYTSVLRVLLTPKRYVRFHVPFYQVVFNVPRTAFHHQDSFLEITPDVVVHN